MPLICCAAGYSVCRRSLRRSERRGAGQKIRSHQGAAQHKCACGGWRSVPPVAWCKARTPKGSPRVCAFFSRKISRQLCAGRQYLLYFICLWKCRWIFTHSGQLQCAGVGRGCSCGSGSFPTGLCDAALKITAAALQRCGMLLIFFADEIIIIKVDCIMKMDT